MDTEEPDLRERTFSRRQYLIYQAVMGGAAIWDAIEIAGSWAIKNPRWDMDETMTWAEWEARGRVH